MTRILNTALLILMLALPLYGARTGVLRPVRAAHTDAEHRADLAMLTVLPKGEFLVTGHGVPRATYGDCHRDLPAFQRVLAAQGFSALEPVNCVETEEQKDVYAPTFRVTSALELELTSISGAHYNSMSFCEIEAQRLFTEYSKKGIVALEFACKKVPKSDISNATEELFTPVVLLLTTPAGANAGRAAASIEALAN